VTRRVPSRPVEPSEARDYASKAEEHLDAARECLSKERWTAATTLAVHAGINAVDAITGMTLRRRGSGEQHEQTLVLLRDVPDGGAVRKHFAPLLDVKPRAEYDAKPVRRSVAEQAVMRAEKLLDIVRDVAERT
jgi:hypothetical protein